MFDQEIYDGEFDFEAEQEGEIFDEAESDFGELEFADELDGGAESGETPFSSAEEMELAAELLTVSDEAELEQFLGKLIKRAWRTGKKFARSSTGRALGGILKGAAKKALPVLGRAAGSYLGGPAGGALGSKLASSAGRLFGLELEGLSPEDMEFETARRFVRFAGNAAQKVATAPPRAPSVQVARAAVRAAARNHAPGLLRAATALPSGRAAFRRSHQRAGRWIRRGGAVIVLGA